MHRIDHPTAVATEPSVDVVGTPGYFQRRNVLTATPGTRVTRDWLNAVQEELMNALEEQGIVTAKGDNFGLSRALSRLGSSNRNVLINPEMSMASGLGVGTLTTTTEDTGFGGPGHWWAKKGSGDSASFAPGSNSTDATRISDITGLGIFHKTVDGASGTPPTIRQSVENVVTLQGSKVVLAFDMRNAGGADPSVSGITAEIVQDFGSGGSADVTTALTSIGATVVDSATWRRFIFTGTLPSIAGKTIGAAGSHLKVRIYFPSGQLFNCYMSAWVLARGSQDPGYTPRPLAQERHLLQRYWETSTFDKTFANFTGAYDVGVWDTAYAGAGTVETLGRKFATQKYASPTVTWLSAQDGSTQAKVTEAPSTDHTVTSSDPNPSHTGFPTISSPPAAGIRTFRAFWAALAEIPD